MLEIERGNTRSRSVENTHWKRLWTCRTTEYIVNHTSQKYCFSITKNKSLILFVEVIAVGSDCHTEHLNTLP